MQQLSAARILATLRQTSDAKAVSARTGTGTKLVTGRVNGCRRNGTGWSNGGPSSNAAVPGQASSLGTRLFFGHGERRASGCRLDESNQKGRTVTIKTKARPSRRSFLKASAGTAALLAAVKTSFLAGVHGAAAGSETAKAQAGFNALAGAGPLFVAKDKGFFAKHGMPNVEVQKQASWGTTRDNLVLGSEGNGIDGAHILTPMPYLISAGRVTQNNVPTPMYILARLNLDSQCISVSNEFLGIKVGVDTTEFKTALAKKKASGKPVKAAMTFPGGTHDLWIRYWLSAGGIDPDKDIETIVVPPPQMVANMKVGTMDCFCVCEPWNFQLIHQHIGYTALTT